jgi:hypothetical protein
MRVIIRGMVEIEVWEDNIEFRSEGVGTIVTITLIEVAIVTF